MRRATASIVSSIVAIVTLLSCAPTMGQGDIILRGYDASNYAALNAALGSRACMAGNVEVDARGARFLLEPYEEDGVITPSPSRVMLRFERRGVTQTNLRDGQRLRVCGALQDATPWDHCARDDCRWYMLKDVRFN